MCKFMKPCGQTSMGAMLSGRQYHDASKLGTGGCNQAMQHGLFCITVRTRFISIQVFCMDRC